MIGSLCAYLSRNQRTITLVPFCKDHRDKTEVPDPLAVEDLISCKFKNKRKLARLITQFYVLRSMFRPFVLFIAAHHYFSGCNVFPLNFEFLRYFFHR